MEGRWRVRWRAGGGAGGGQVEVGRWRTGRWMGRWRGLSPPRFRVRQSQDGQHGVDGEWQVCRDLPVVADAAGIET